MSLRAHAAGSWRETTRIQVQARAHHCPRFSLTIQSHHASRAGGVGSEPISSQLSCWPRVLHQSL